MHAKTAAIDGQLLYKRFFLMSFPTHTIHDSASKMLFEAEGHDIRIQRPAYTRSKDGESSIRLEGRE